MDGELSGILPMPEPLGIGNVKTSATLAVSLHHLLSAAMMAALINLHLLLLLASLTAPLLLFLLSPSPTRL